MTEGYLDENIQQAGENVTIQASPGSWVLAPIPVSNPTVGSGLQAVLLYLHPKSDDSEVSNTTSGLAGMFTNNQSWAAGAFHDGNWDSDLYRYRAFAGMGEFNLKYYGIGDDTAFADQPVNYSMRARGLGGQLQRRMPGARHWYAGFSYSYMDSDVGFKLAVLQPGLPDVSKPFRNAGPGLLATYDSRDDNYYPHKGQLLELSLTNYGNNWGGDYDYSRLKTDYNYYIPVRSDTVIALRAYLQSVNGNVPFFALPNLDMRGFSRDRYRDERSLSTHVEVRHKFTKRWGAVVFVEAGWVAGDFGSLLKQDAVTSRGIGLRWQATEDKALHLGLDLAASGGNSVIYVRVGEMF